ncbi:Scr1 family TA system antitoxin-like transcriptional regulator [Streptomyces virginiae]|uniref:Scr1 family TA system antitoxin-like transcriptional regulator n=1 Tax=Streptomyces virginiae TaxID=1961 RepID=UPI0035E0C50A
MLHRRMGGTAAHRGQLRHILAAGSRRTVHLQVMPMGCDKHPAMEGSFTRLPPKGRQGQLLRRRGRQLRRGGRVPRCGPRPGLQSSGRPRSALSPEAWSVFLGHAV